MQNRKILTAFLALIFLNLTIQAQTGGGFTITQSVIAGGGQNAGGTFSIAGTIGQPVAGSALTGSPFAVTSGFWNFAPLAPTAASVTISGRVLTAKGSGLMRAIVSISDGSGELRSVITASSGFYRFENVRAGETYIFEVRSKKYQFAPQVVSVIEEITELNFTAAQ